MRSNRRRAALIALAVLAVALLSIWLASFLASSDWALDSDEDTERDAPRLRRRIHSQDGTPGRVREHVVPEPADPLVAPQQKAEPLGLGTLFGTLHDPFLRLSAEGVLITVQHIDGSRIAGTRTTKRGNYEIRNLPHDVPLIVRIEKRKYLSGIFGDVVLRAHERTEKSAELRRLAPIIVTLRGPGPIELLQGVPLTLVQDGRIVDHTTLTVSDEDRRVSRRNALDKLDRLDNDEVALFAPTFGKFEIRVGGNGFVAAAPAVEVTVGPGRRLKETIHLEEGAELNVHVIDELGGDIPGATVTVGAEALNAVTATSDASGIATFPGLTARHRLDVHAEVPETALVGRASTYTRSRHVTTVNVTVREAHALSLAVLSADGAPVPNVAASIRMAGDAVVREGVTDAEGRVQFSGLPDGKVDVRLAPARARGQILAFETAPPAGDIETHSVVLAATDVARAAGVVRDEEGEPVPGARVHAFPAGIKVVASESGAFVFPHLPAGEEQHLLARAKGYRMAPGHPQTVVPRIGTTAGVELLVVRHDAVADGDGPGSNIVIRDVTGRVTRIHNQPVEGARVHAGGARAETRQDGSFRIRGARFLRTAWGAETTLEVLPRRGLLMAEFVTIETREGDEVVDTDVTLRTRPYAQIDYRTAVHRTEGVASEFSVVSEMADLAGGRRTAPFEEITCVTYDGHWPLLPPFDEWLSRGTARFVVIAPSSRGPLLQRFTWRMRRDDAPVFTVKFRDAIRDVVVRETKDTKKANVRLTLQGSPSDVWLERETDGAASIEMVDPLEHCSVERLLAKGGVRRHKRWSLAAGVWSYEVVPRGKSDDDRRTGTFDTERSGRVTLE